MKCFPFVCIIVSIFSFQELASQMIIPKFQTPVLMETLSSDAEESMPLPFNNGTSFYFYRTYVEGTGSRTKIKGQDIWFSKMAKKGWSKPYRLFSAEYLKGQNSIIGSSTDGKQIYLFSTIYTDSTSERKIITLVNQGKDKWTDAVEIKIPGLVFGEKYYSFYMNPTGTILMASISPSEDLLDEDLFVSLKDESGNWSNLIDLGKEINSRRFEVSPYIADDGKTLYFASNGHGGFGESDIFVSHRLDDSWTNWTKPLNLGEPINSSEFDAFFILGNNKEVFFTSSRGSEHSNIYKTVATGEFTFANIDSVSGQFFYRGLPGDNMTLRIEDENGNFIDEIVTDAYGRFRYVKLDEESSYLIKLAAEDDSVFVGSKIYFVDENGKKTERYILTEDGIFVNEKDMKGREKVQGIFTFKKLPGQNIGLVILDENGFPLDTVFTDDSGRFSYSMLKYDGKYSIVPLNYEDNNWDDIELYLVDINGEKVQRLEFKENQFVRYDINDKEQILANNRPTGGFDKKFEKGEAIELSAWNGMSETNKQVYFDFGKVEPNEEELRKLSLLISILQYDESVKVKLTGHTDNYGDEGVNIKVGLNRASFVNSYLIGKGIAQKRISISSEGESSPIAPNYTFEGKAKNRRVEISLQ